MKALFVVDNRPDVGKGHIVRCQALAVELESRGWTTETIISSMTSGQMQKQSAVAAQDVTVFDLRADLRRVVIAKPCVEIVDEVGAVCGCDVLVNGSAGASPELYAGKVGAARVLAGPSYSLLRHAFAAARQVPRIRRRIIDLRSINIWNPADLALEISSAQVAITYGGMRAMECACLGTPMVVIPRNEGEHLNAAGLVEAGACVVADDSEAEVMAQTMLDCPRLVEKMSRNAWDLVDGKGCRRVAQVIGELVL